MSKPSFIYVIYIDSTPQKVWDALMDGEMTKLYWGRHENVSDWKPGSTWEHRQSDPPHKVDLVGTVLESDRPRKLIVTWADPEHADRSDRTSRVTFLIEPFAGAVRLRILHEDLDPEMHEGITQGWPAILSSLKSLLETGRPLTMTTRCWS
jgi:uncharacterized protein YndB with AHSA1/START domain